MPTIQVRNVPEGVHRTLRVRAAALGKSLQEYVLDQLIEDAQTRDLADVVAESRAEIEEDPERASRISAVEILRDDRRRH